MNKPKTEISDRTMMRLFYFTLIIALPTLVFGQNQSVQPATQELETAIEITGPDLIKKYSSYQGAVLNMTREEWDIFREWEGYDERQIIEILEEHKQPYYEGREQRKAARVARSNECDCWVEPDNSYTQVTTSDWTSSGGAGLDVDCFIGPISLGGWQYDHYGNTFNDFWINSKGTVSFGNGYINWTPQEFPAATYDQIAGFWADSDFRATGELWYKVTPEAVYVNFIEVGYFNNHDDLANTFQIIFTPSNNGLLGDEYNVQLCYLDMQWAHGDVGGSGGFNGPTPANVGCDAAASSGPNIQYGRFNLNNNNYNGPYGGGLAQQDGVHWLDFKQFDISTVGGATSNIPPIPTQSFGCDIVTLCLGDTLEFDMQFLAPEPGQIVTVTADVDGDQDGLFITSNFPGNTATFIGGFAGDAGNVGTHTVTLTATDDGNPAASTEVSITIEVIPVELPPLTVSGNLAICAGSSTEVTASGGFDSYVWSSGCTTQSCEIQGGGTYQVTGFFDACSTTQSFNIEATPFFLPCININPNPVCSNDTATVQVCQNAQLETYVDFIWEGNWNGLGGEVYESDGPMAQVSPGTYRLLVENDEGCFGQRVFIVEGIDAFIPADVWSGAYCDGLEEVTFTGGFSNPASGILTIYLTSSDANGWNGSFINIIIDGEVVNTVTSTGTFFIIQQPIESGEFIELEFVSSGIGNDANYGIQLFNCVNSNSATIANMENGIVYAQESGCSSQPAFGEWEIVSGPGGGSFSTTAQFNSTFTPDNYGLYEICFAEAACGVLYCYDLEYTETPEISLNESEVLICGDESATIVATIVDIGGTASIDWPAPGTNDVLSNTYSFDAPADETLTVTITNGCGSDSEEVNIVVQADPIQPELEDAVLCEGGVVELVAAANPTSDLEFEWTFNGSVVSDDSELIADQTGEYCVTVSNQCVPQGFSSCAELAFAGDIPSPTPGTAYECNGGNSVTINSNFPSDGWSIEWPDGSTGPSYTTSQNGTVIALVTDPGDCETTEYATTVYIGTAPVANPNPTELVVLCPEISNVFEIGVNNGTSFSWDISCESGINLEGNAALTLNSSQLSPECWGTPLTLTGTASNPCGSASADFFVEIDPCAIDIPNIFSPNNDGINDAFFVNGLDVYRDVYFRVYNRWGDNVYESDNYRSGAWRGADAEDGTYFYVLILPNGREYTGTVNIVGSNPPRRR